jgi:hypothetical protein
MELEKLAMLIAKEFVSVLDEVLEQMMESEDTTEPEDTTILKTMIAGRS